MLEVIILKEYNAIFIEKRDFKVTTCGVTHNSRRKKILTG